MSAFAPMSQPAEAAEPQRRPNLKTALIHLQKKSFNQNFNQKFSVFKALNRLASLNTWTIINNGHLESAFNATAEEEDKEEATMSVTATQWTSLVAAVVVLVLECLHTEGFY